MNQQRRFTFNKRNAIFLGLCLGGLVLLVAISVVPLKTQHQALDRETATLKQRLDRQRQNQDGLALLDKALARLDQQPSPEVVVPSPLPQTKSGQITQDVEAMARENSLAVSTIDPQLENTSSWQTLTVRVTLQGQLPNLRPFLLKLLALPYVRQIDRVEIHPAKSGLTFTLTYTIDLA